MAKRNPDVWQFLRSCRKCNKVHTPHPYRDGIWRGGVTWIDPDDGHQYAPRVNPEILDQLRAEYDAAAGISQPRAPLGQTVLGLDHASAQ